MVNTVNQQLSEEFVKQSILKYDNSFDLSNGTPFYDLFVRFFQYTTLPEIIRIYNEMIDARSLLNTNVSNTDYDRLLTTLNFPRQIGNTCKVNFTLVLNEPQELNLRTTDKYIIGSNIYHPMINQDVTTDQWLQDGEVYTLEFLLESNLTGENQNVGINVEVETPYNNESTFVRAFTTTIDTVAKDDESNEAVLSRIQSEYGLETLINARGINFILSKYFPNQIQSVFIAGFSEIEQRRDIRMMEVPKRIIRLYFSQKINMTIPINTQIHYDNNPSIKYIFRNGPITVTNTSTLWKDFVGGGFYIDFDIELLDKYNIDGFREDVPASIPFFNTGFPDYKGCHTRTTAWENEDAKIRVGAHTDVYLKTAVVRQKVPIFVPINSDGIIEIPPEYQPILKIHKIEEISNQGVLSPVEIYSMIVDEPNLRFSARDNVKLYVKPSLVGTNILVDMTYAPKIKEIQNFCERPLLRVIAEDCLIRYYNPCFVGVFSVVTGSPTFDPNLKEAVTSYVNSINTGSIILSDLVSRLGNEVPQLRAIFMDSLQMVAQQELPDGTYVSIVGDESLTPYTNEDIGVTSRNVTFLLEAVEFDYK